MCEIVKIYKSVVLSIRIRSFHPPVRVGLPHSPVGELPHTSAIWEEQIFLAVGEFYRLNAVLFDALDSSIGENTLLLTIRKYAFDCAVRETMEKN